MGRLLITLLLYSEGILDTPILYLSLYLKQHRTTYYDLLQQVRTQGAWEKWLAFFLESVIYSAKQLIKTAETINTLFTTDSSKIETLGRARFSCMQVFECLKKQPLVSAPLVAKKVDITAPTARSALNQLLKLGIVTEISGKKRGHLYAYSKYLQLLEEGAEPL